MANWRQVGLNYVNYSQIAARIVRQALKQEFRVEAEKRGESSVRVSHWKDGKPLKRS